MHTPRATYRLQLHAGFPLTAAADVVPYLAALGISDAYLSPIAEATEGSAHGYDVTDPTRVSGALGGEPALRSLADAVAEAGMGLLLDIVPNHMAASVESPWWSDLLARGPESEHARAFDVEWQAHWTPARGKLLLPVLGKPYARVLEARELELAVGDEGDLVVRHFDRVLPTRPETAADVRALGDGDMARGARRVSDDPAELDRILSAQHYRLALWRTESSELNWRRFFDITALAGLRTEDPAVFQAVHALPLRLVREGMVTGLRVDHVDGLRDPTGYLERLRAHAPAVYLVVEKILSEDEALPEEWPVAGTTGYGFMNRVNRLLVDEAGLDKLDGAYRRFTGRDEPFESVLWHKKERALERLFGSEVRALAWRLGRLAAEHTVGRDLSLGELERAVVGATASLAVYRTYLREGSEALARPAREDDRRLIETALAGARERAPELDVALEMLGRVLLPVEGAWAEGMEAERSDFVARWQQLTGPAMAKGGEDTALYTYARLVSLNEVGGEPDAGALEPEAFHRLMRRRMERRPSAMSATATHDAKRGEDVRARIAVLSELADEWAGRVARWRERNAPAKEAVAGQPAPDANDEWLLYQTLIGAWPLDDAELPEFRDRLDAYLIKAAREAKRQTSWREPNEAYERALTGFARRIVDDGGFVADFLELQRRVAWYGMLNSLSQLVLKCAAPGVPDFYQGTELWSLVLVDPDNRREVDFGRRAEMLRDLEARDPSPELAAELMGSWEDGRLKLWMTRALLRARASHSELFARGEYIPIPVEGHTASGAPAARHVVAFARRLDQEWAFTVVPRLTSRLGAPGVLPAGEGVWGDAVLRLPAGAPTRWRDAMTGRRIDVGVPQRLGPLVHGHPAVFVLAR